MLFGLEETDDCRVFVLVALSRDEKFDYPVDESPTSERWRLGAASAEFPWSTLLVGWTSIWMEFIVFGFCNRGAEGWEFFAGICRVSFGNW